MDFLWLLLVKSYMNWFAIVWNHYKVAYFKIIMMVYFILLLSAKTFLSKNKN